MNEKIKILLVEDLESDAMLIDLELHRADLAYNLKRVWTRAEFLKEVKDFAPDIILSDFNLPQMNALDVLKARNENGYAHIPLILVTGTQTDEVAIECLKAGAADYLHKTSAGMTRLPHAIQTVLKTVALQRERDKALEALQVKSKDLEACSQNLRQGNSKDVESKVANLLKEVDTLLQQVGQPKKFGTS